MSCNIVKTLLLLVALQAVAQLADGQSFTCGGTFTDQSGTFASPNFPADYQNDTDCTYIIEVESGQVVKLTFTSFLVEYKSDCSYDFVEVNDTDGNQIGKFCGLIHDDTVSSGNVMVVRFKSDSYVQTFGFQASYSAYDLASDSNDCSPNPCQNGGTCTDQVFTYDCICAAGYVGQNCQGPNACGGTLTAASSTFYSPGYPAPYPGNSNCTYTVQVAAGSRVQLNITHDIKACYDYYAYFYYGYYEEEDSLPILSVYNGTSSDTLLEELCGHGAPTYTSTGNTMTLVFVTGDDINVYYQGFAVSYTTV